MDRRAELLMGTPPHVAHPAGIRIWFTEPYGIVGELTSPKVSLEIARFLVGPISDVLEARRRPGERIHIVHDFTCAADYDPDARVMLTDWCLHHRRALALAAIVIRPTRALIRLGIETAAAVLRIADAPFEYGEHLEPLLAKYRLKPNRIVTPSDLPPTLTQL